MTQRALCLKKTQKGVKGSAGFGVSSVCVTGSGRLSICSVLEGVSASTGLGVLRLTVDNFTAWQ